MRSVRNLENAFVLLTFLLLSSCSSIPDFKHEGVSEQKYQADYTECVMRSGQANMRRRSRSGFVKRCMIGRGYTGEEM